MPWKRASLIDAVDAELKSKTSLPGVTAQASIKHQVASTREDKRGLTVFVSGFQTI